MGLDSYLDRVKKVKDVPFSVLKTVDDVDTLKEKNIDLYNKIQGSIIKRGSNFTWESIFEEVGYWRKANHIHKWFVQNVQNSEDDCNYYEVNKEDIETLLNDCNNVIESLKNQKLMTKIIKDDYSDEDYSVEMFFNTDVAEEVLPTQEGFFFGGTNYDDYYLEKTEYTKKICEKILKEFDFNGYHLCYCSSW